MVKYRIVSSAGHGGKDPGAVANNLKEKYLTEKVSTYRDEMLREDVNYDVLSIRKGDEYISVDNRVAIAKGFKPDLIIADHFNAGRGDGAEIYLQSNVEAPHSKSLRFAKILANQLSDMQNLRGIDGARYALLVNGNIAFAESNYTNPKGYRSYYGELRNSPAPSVLAEYAFIDNLNDIKEFVEEDDLKRLAARGYLAICEYFATTPIFDKDGNRIDGEQIVPPQNNMPYRVRISANDVASQIGAFNSLDTAKQLADKNYGYEVYDKNDKLIYDPTETQSFTVKVTTNYLNVRLNPTTIAPVLTVIGDRGTYTILEVKAGKGSEKGYGRLKAKFWYQGKQVDGWVSLDYVQKI